MQVGGQYHCSIIYLLITRRFGFCTWVAMLPLWCAYQWMPHLAYMGQMLGKEGDLPLEPSLRVGTVKALIKAPLKNNYNPQRRLVRSEKNYFGPLGVPWLERRLRIRAQLRPLQSDLQQPSYNSPKWRCRMRTRLEVRLDCRCRCERNRNYSTTVHELGVLEVAQIGS